MPAGRLNLYRFVEDAWSGGLRAWCEEGGESWLLVENAGQTRWLSRKFKEEGIADVRIFDADGLREHFARLAGIDPVPPDAAAAAFVVRVAAGEGTSGALAEACDALARAGWHLNQLGVDPAVARQLHRSMERTAVLAGIFERRLREALPAQAARLCCVGWDATRWPDLGLLDLAAAKMQSCEVFVPSPRLPADAQQREWIEALEQRLGLERVTCPESGFASENEPLVARLENSQLASRSEARAPSLLVGREWPDEVALVCRQVAAWLAEKPALPIGVIAQEDSSTAVAVAEALEIAGVRVEHAGRMREPRKELLILEQVARYHLSGHDIGELIELANLLWLHRPHESEPLTALDPQAVRDALDRAFQAAQSRNARILMRALPRRNDALWPALCNLIEALGRWEGDLPWPALLEKWGALLSALRLPADTLGAWPTGLFEEGRVPARAFIEWLADHLAAQRRADVARPDYAALAPVVVTTFAGAAQQTWSRLIFLDSNEHLWPEPIVENPFLPDAVRARLNLNRHESGRLLTTHDLRALDQARFLDLVEHCHGPIAFAGLLLGQSDSQAQPNEWVLRALIETGSFAPDLWAASAQTCPPPAPPALDEAEIAHLERVHSSRRNGTMPFDRYLFNFHETKLEPGAWSATDLDKAIACPATFALRELFGAAAAEPLFRGEGAAVGNRAHRWLGCILGLRDHLAAPEPAADDDAKLARELAAAHRELEQWYGAENMTVPLWWETCLRKTAWAARRCLREVRRALDGARFCAMEQKLAVTVRTPAGPLLLKGRIDILIGDCPEIAGARVRIFDFKTGRGAAPTLASLAKGQGAQFAAYYLMARDAGATEAVIGIIKPEDRARDVFGAADEADLRAHFGLLAELRRTLRFGMRGALVSEHGVSETLPMATVAIDPAILEQKAGLFLLAQ